MHFEACERKKKLSRSVQYDTAIWQEYVSASGLYLKIRILLRCRASDDHIRAG